MKTVAFIPIKMNNQRLPGKNLMRIGGVPLVTRICQTALQVSEIDEVYVFCSSPKICEYLPREVVYLSRDSSLDSASTSITEVTAAFVNRKPAEIYVSLMATAPFISSDTIAVCIRAVQSGKYDSAFPVCRLNEFLWIDGKPNYDLENVPRTQDLPPTYAETCGLYCFNRDSALRNLRIGALPYMHEVDKIEALDIDTRVDFDLAAAIHAWFQGGSRNSD